MFFEHGGRQFQGKTFSDSNAEAKTLTSFSGKFRTYLRVAPAVIGLEEDVYAG
jgi:hypothetical protein